MSVRNAGAHPDHDASAGAPAPAHHHASRGRIEWPMHRRLRRRAAAWGGGAGAALFGVYLGVLGLANSLEHALDEIARLWLWMLPLVAGFALQVGLFVYARAATRGRDSIHSRGVAASGGASALSMVACCAHHLTDVLPLVGLAGATLFLARYQTLFLLLGLLSNAVGLVYVLGLLHEHGLYPERRSLLSVAARIPLGRAWPIVAIVCAVVFATAVVVAIL